MTSRTNSDMWGAPNDFEPRSPGRRYADSVEKSGPRWIWWGWRNTWKRPVWYSRGWLGAPDARELGIGPISRVWVRETSTRQSQMMTDD